MKKKTTGGKRGRPTKAARDCMVPMSSSVPAPLRDLIQGLADTDSVTRSTKVVEVLKLGIKAVDRAKRRREGSL